MSKVTPSNVSYFEKAPSWRSCRAHLFAGRKLSTHLIFDENLRSHPAFEKWWRAFPSSFQLAAGENLKTLDAAGQFLEERLLPATRGFGREEIVLVAAGGGSVGDFCGFVASVLKRGVILVHVPTTYLAALDSAHGGKTALNVGGFKNQIGTFYPAREVVIVREFLKTQGADQQIAAGGELFKSALIAGGPFYRDLVVRGAAADAEFEALLWHFLPATVALKNRIVARDPFETRGERLKLNLGHTLGHALEIKAGWSHGLAVAHGLHFALTWSFHRGSWSAPAFRTVMDAWTRWFGATLAARPRLIEAELRDFLLRDKKAIRGNRLRFVFPLTPGRVQVEEVKVSEILKEGRRQGWLA